MTLKKETLNIMAQNGKEIEDIEFISVLSQWDDIPQQYMRIDINEFFIEAEDSDYCCNKDIPCVDITLNINFKDGSWMERWVENGIEGWRFFSRTPEVDCPTWVQNIWNHQFKPFDEPQRWQPWRGAK